MLSDKEKRDWDAIDKAAVRAGGYFAVPKRPVVMEYDYRAMTMYCKEKKLSKMDLSEDELKLFEFNPPLVYA